MSSVFPDIMSTE